jgi:hypothetical protein
MVSGTLDSFIKPLDRAIYVRLWFPEHILFSSAPLFVTTTDPRGKGRPAGELHCNSIVMAKFDFFLNMPIVYFFLISFLFLPHRLQVRAKYF